MNSANPAASRPWYEIVQNTLKRNDVKLVTYVPDKVFTPLIKSLHADNDFLTFATSREEEALGVLSGAWMGGRRGAVLMQTSGFGTIPNVLASLVVPYQIPAIMFVSERGTLGEFNLGQAMVCRTMRPVLESLAVEHHTITRHDELEFIVDRSVKQSVRDPGRRRLHPVAAAHRRQSLREVRSSMSNQNMSNPNFEPDDKAPRPASYDNAKVVNRFDLTKRLVAKLKKDEAVIGGIGNTNFDLWAAGRRPQNFYMLGSMGLAIPIALGVAIAQPHRHVIALEGDGSLLMQLGCLVTIAALKPANLTMVIMDNGLYQITGGQPTPAAGTADYVALARAAGLAKSAWAADEEDFESLVDAALAEGGPTFIAARIDDKPGVGTTDRDPVQIRERFMHGLGVRGV